MTRKKRTPSKKFADGNAVALSCDYTGLALALTMIGSPRSIHSYSETVIHQTNSLHHQSSHACAQHPVVPTLGGPLCVCIHACVWIFLWDGCLRLCACVSTNETVHMWGRHLQDKAVIVSIFAILWIQVLEPWVCVMMFISIPTKNLVPMANYFAGIHRWIGTCKIMYAHTKLYVRVVQVRTWLCIPRTDHVRDED